MRASFGRTSNTNVIHHDRTGRNREPKLTLVPVVEIKKEMKVEYVSMTSGIWCLILTINLCSILTIFVVY